VGKVGVHGSRDTSRQIRKRKSVRRRTKAVLWGSCCQNEGGEKEQKKVGRERCRGGSGKDAIKRKREEGFEKEGCGTEKSRIKRIAYMKILKLWEKQAKNGDRERKLKGSTLPRVNTQLNEGFLRGVGMNASKCRMGTERNDAERKWKSEKNGEEKESVNRPVATSYRRGATNPIGRKR